MKNTITNRVPEIIIDYCLCKLSYNNYFVGTRRHVTGLELFDHLLFVINFEKNFYWCVLESIKFGMELDL